LEKQYRWQGIRDCIKIVEIVCERGKPDQSLVLWDLGRTQKSKPPTEGIANQSYSIVRDFWLGLEMGLVSMTTKQPTAHWHRFPGRGRPLIVHIALLDQTTAAMRAVMLRLSVYAPPV
jgi:hypothetical protein